MKNKTKKKGSFLIVTGLLLIAAALVFVGYNLWTEQKSGESSDAVSRELMKLIAEETAQSQTQENGQWVFLPQEASTAWNGQWLLMTELAPEEIANADSGRRVFVPDADADQSMPVDRQAGRWVFVHESLLKSAPQEASDGKWVYLAAPDAFEAESSEWMLLSDAALDTAEIMAQSGCWVFLPDGNERGRLENGAAGKWVMLPIHAVQTAAASELMFMQPVEQALSVPDYIVNPERDMPEMLIDGNQYIGMLQIPALELQLPIMSEWSYPQLRIAPCRYTGSAYQDNLVICGHNYSRHFGQLGSLRTGTEINFTDADGNLFRYSVVELETLKPEDVEQMVDGDWDLTLFTCTVGGATRITVRCDRC